MTDRDAIIRRRRALTAAAAMSTVTLTASSASPQICLSIAEPEPQPCDAHTQIHDPRSVLREAQCHATTGDLSMARETYQRFLAISEDDDELVHDRKRAEWAIRRIDLVMADEKNPRKPVPALPAPEPAPPTQDVGIEVIADTPAPKSAGPASCRCEIETRPKRGGWWLALLGTVAFVRRRLPWLVVFGVACQPPPAEPEVADTPPPQPATTEDAAIAEELPPDGLSIPVVVRCKTGDVCDTVVRVRRDNGAVEHLSAGWIPRESPVLVDDDNVYWAGGAATKRDLSHVELDWRSTRLRYIEQNRDHLIVVDREGVYLLPKDGSPRRVIAAGKSIWSADASATLIGWTIDRGSGTGDVVVADHAGAVVQTLNGEASPYGARIFDDTLYWYNFGNTPATNPSGTIRTLRRGAPQTLARGQLVPRDLTVTASHVYWVTDVKEGRIVRRVPDGGGAPQKLGVSHELHGHRSNGDRILVHGKHVYWNAAHSVVRVPITGGDARIVVTLNIPGDIKSFAIDNAHIYVAAHMFRRRGG